MKTITRFMQASVLAVLFSAAHAESIQCQEIVPPATITQGGAYCLKNSHSTSSADVPAISVNASNVTIDLNGFVLENTSAARPNLSVGVQVGRASGVTVRNGAIRGYGYAVKYDAQEGDPIRDQLVEDLMIYGAEYCGVCMTNQRGVVRRNFIANFGGGSSGASVAIAGVKSSLDILDNDIMDIRAPNEGTVVGIGLSGSVQETSVIEGNRISSMKATHGMYATGIYLYQDTPAVVRGNSVLCPTELNSTAYGIRSLTASARITGNTVNVPGGVDYEGGLQVSGTNF